MKVKRGVVTRGVVLVTVAWCLGPAPAARALTPDWRLPLGPRHELVIGPDGAWALRGPTGARLLAGEPAVQLDAGRLWLGHFFGTFRFHGEPIWRRSEAPVRVEAERDALVLRRGGKEDGGAWSLRFERVGPAGLRVVASARDPRVRRVVLGLRVDGRERLFGFGSRTNASSQRGRSVENWVQEGGNGKSEQPVFGVSNYPTASHVPIPYCLSTAGFGLTIESPRRSAWEVGVRAADALDVAIDANRLSLLVDLAPSPAALLAAHTARIGRPHMPPDWAFGPTEFGKGGTRAVWEKARLLRAEGVPASAIWYEDWVGLERGPLPGLTHLPWGRWVADAGHYPEVDRLNDSLEALGFKSLGYFNPFLSAGDPHAREAFERGYALKDRAGRTVFSPGPFGLVAHLDPTHPGARAWAYERLATFERLGFDGAMVDFGEWVPPEATFADGSSGWEQHNRYPDLWAGLHRAFWERARPDGDFLFYTRAGWTGAARAATYMWAGDQNTNWGEDDGFPTALRAILSAGLSGVPLMTHDVAGFATLGNEGVTRELYWRWVAFGAFSTFMRSHSGQKPSLNWRIDSDPETLAHHRRYARVHMALLPYRKAVVREAVETGLPAMRHLALAYPGVREAWDVEDAYMLGPELLVAPVMRPGATQRKVWLPPGEWVGFWDGRRERGGRWLEVATPLATLPVWVRAGAILPVWPETVMTALDSRDPAVPGREAERGILRLRLFAGPGRSLTLADGVRVSHSPPVGSQAALLPLSARLDDGAAALTRESGAWVVRGRLTKPTSSLVIATAAGPWAVRIEGRPPGLSQLVVRLEP